MGSGKKLLGVDPRRGQLWLKQPESYEFFAIRDC
jgi:hypothetical protein